MNTNFSIGSFIKSSWTVFKSHWKFLLLAVLATVVVQAILQVLQNGARYSGGVILFIISIFAVLIGLIIVLGWTRVLLQLNRNASELWDNFKTKPALWVHYIKTLIWYFLYTIKWLVITILPTLIVFGILRALVHGSAGSIISIILGIVMGVTLFCVMVYISVRYQFINFVVVDNHGLRSKVLFKKAGLLTKGYFWKLLGFGIVMGLLNLLGLICLGVGLLVSIPVTKLAQARVYDFLKHANSV